MLKIKTNIRIIRRRETRMTRCWNFQTLSVSNKKLVRTLKRWVLLNILRIVGHMKWSSRIWKPRGLRSSIRIGYHSFRRSISRILSPELLFCCCEFQLELDELFQFWFCCWECQLELEELFQFWFWLRSVRMIIMAIVAIVGGLILRIESVVTCESIVIVLKTHLTLDRASTTAATTTTTTTLVATSTLIITTTRNPRIRGILVCICHIGIRGRIRARIIISYGLRRVSMIKIHWCSEGIAQWAEFDMFFEDTVLAQGLNLQLLQWRYVEDNSLWEQ